MRKRKEMDILEALELALSVLQNELNRADPENKLLGRSQYVDDLCHAARLLEDHIPVVADQIYEEKHDRG